MKIALISLSIVLAIHCTAGLPQNLNSRVVNGHEATPHSLPYQVYLNVTRPSNTSPCGGSLISSKYVLTAAHCLTDGSDATVYLGAHNIEELETTQIRTLATKFITHESYDGFIFNDIALIELDLNVEFTDAIQPIPLITRAEADTVIGKQALASGWGLLSTTQSSPVLLQATGNITKHSDDSRCSSFISESLEICWLGASSVCSGDSGGPLVVDGKLVGLVSYGDSECSVDKASFFVKVSGYLDWIAANSDVVVA